MHEKSLVRSFPEVAEPTQNLLIIRMTAQVLESFDARPDVYVLAKHFDRLTCLDEPATRTGRLKTHKEDGVC